MMLRIILLAGLSISSMLLVGCATMISGTTQEMSFQSSPEEVVVTMISRVRGEGPDYVWHDETRILGKTPMTMQLDKEEGRSVIFSRTGYKTVTVKLTTATDPNFWGNIMFGGLIGSTTDSLSGAIIQYAPSQFFVTLTPDGGSRVENSTVNSPRDKAREFIVRRHTSIMTDLSKGSGEDLITLLRLLHIDPDQDTDARRKILALSQVYTDAAAFANHVAELFLK